MERLLLSAIPKGCTVYLHAVDQINDPLIFICLQAVYAYEFSSNSRAALSQTVISVLLRPVISSGRDAKPDIFDLSGAF